MPEIRRSTGIDLYPGYLGPRPGGGYSGATQPLDDAVAGNAEALAREYGRDVQIRFNSDRESGGAFIILPESDLELGLTSQLRPGGRITYDAIIVTRASSGIGGGTLTAASHEREWDGRYHGYETREEALAWLEARVPPRRPTMQMTFRRETDRRREVRVRAHRRESHVSDRCQRQISRKIRKLRHEGYEQDQAAAIAYSQARKRGCKIPRRNN